MRKRNGTLALLAVGLAAASILFSGCIPKVVIDGVSPYGDANGTVSGHVTGVKNPQDYRILCIIDVQDVWWSKPYAAWPFTEIKSDRTWSITIQTGGNDRCATRVAVYLVPKDAEAVLCLPCTEMPDISAAVSQDTIDRSPPVRTIRFDNRDWTVRSSPICPLDPGPNYFSDSEDDVSVDGDGRLVLWIRHRNGKWWSTEVVAKESYGYGVYKVVFNSRLDILDVNEIGAAFLFDTHAPEVSYREIDLVEFTRWGNPDDPTNAQFVVHPCNACPGCSDRCTRFRTDLTDADMLQTLILVWQPNEAHFRLYRGDYFDTASPPAEALVHEWAKIGGVPTPGDEKFRFNMWLLNGQAPEDGMDRSMVVERFGFDPTLPVCGNGEVEVGEQCDDGNTAPNDGCSASCEEESGLVITGVSPYGDTDGRVWGKVGGYEPEDYKVAVYILVGAGWWTKPFWAWPTTQIEDDGTWTCDVTTGGSDHQATEIRAYLIPASYSPPLMSGQTTLPAELEENAVSWDRVERAPAP